MSMKIFTKNKRRKKLLLGVNDKYGDKSHEITDQMIANLQIWSVMKLNALSENITNII